MPPGQRRRRFRAPGRAPAHAASIGSSRGSAGASMVRCATDRPWKGFRRGWPRAAPRGETIGMTWRGGVPRLFGVVLGGLVLVPVLAVLPAAVLDRGPTGALRGTAFHVALAA